MKIEWKNLFRTIAVLEALLLLVLTFSYGNKIDELKTTIDNQTKKIEKYRKEIIELKMVEESYTVDKDYIYECYKQIENSAERSGK